MAHILSWIRELRRSPTQRTETATQDAVNDRVAATVKLGDPPTLPLAPLRSGLWGRIPTRDPDRG